jgi:plastocyanin
MQFSPADLTLHSGDRIVWVNKDLFPHTATANDKTFDSGSIDSGGSWRFEVNNKGDYAYSCTFHPTMKGQIHVR